MTGQEYAKALREIAAWWDEHPDLPSPDVVSFNVWLSTKDELRNVARHFSKTTKGIAGNLFWLRVKLPRGVDLDFNVPRAAVCTSRVVGTRTVPARPATPEHTEDVVEWDCEPLLEETRIVGDSLNG